MNILTLAAALTLDGSRFKAGLREAQAASSKFSRDVSGDIKGKLAGAFGVAALGYGIKRLIDLNSEIKDTADSLDISTKALQEQQFWITQNGGTISDLTAAYRGLAKARAAALGGNEDKMGIFNALGIDQAQLVGGKLEEIFAQAAEGFRTKDFGADKIASVMEIFGKGGTSILPALNQSLAEASEEAQRLGQVIGKDVNESLEAMGDKIDVVFGKLRNVGSGAIFHLARGLDMLFTGAQTGMLGLFNMFLGLVGREMSLLGKIPGMGALKSVGKAVESARSEAAGISDELYKQFEARWAVDPKKEKKKKMPDDDEDSQDTAVREAFDRIQSGAAHLPDIPASEVSSLTRAGQLSGRSFSYSNKEAERQMDLARETLKVEREQLQRLNEIAQQRQKTIRVNP